MNPRPKIINLGFYILISNFNVHCHVSFEMDTGQDSLKNLTHKDQTPLISDPALATP